MLNRIIGTRLIVTASLGLIALGLIVSSTDTSATPSHTSATAAVQLLPNGVFGWD